MSYNDGLIAFPGGGADCRSRRRSDRRYWRQLQFGQNDHQVEKAGVDAISFTDLPSHPWRT